MRDFRLMYQDTECIYVANGTCYTSELTDDKQCIMLVIIHIIQDARST
jgi:hypothetical protein